MRKTAEEKGSVVGRTELSNERKI
jgi:hypothetical protein